MTEYAPLVGFDTLHDYPVLRTRAELEFVFPGATQMSGRSLYLSVSQACSLDILHWFCSTIYPPYISSSKRVRRLGHINVRFL